MYVCSSCGQSSAMKLWKCPSCESYGSFVSVQVDGDSKSKRSLKEGRTLTQRKDLSSHFWRLENEEFLRVMQHGIKQWSLYLLGGEPGIGKSTLLIQILQDLAANNKDMKIAYFTGEEQVSQISDRRHRLDPKRKNPIESISLFHATHIEDIVQTSKDNEYDMIIIDSIQTIYTSGNDSAPGSPNQVRFCTEKLSEFSSETQCTVFIIGHVTKWGEIAGPKYLEHIVDVVMYLEWDRFGQLRFLRSQKNRFGHTDDSGIFEMTPLGLNPVYDIQERIIKSTNTNTPWSVLSIGLDNGRPVLVHLEVLLIQTQSRFPQRTSIGVDNKRVELLIAILEKYMKMNLGVFDVYVNLPGEFRMHDSWLDLAIAAAIVSHHTKKVIGNKRVFIGEMWLSGQVIKSKLHDKRCKEVPKWFDIIDKDAVSHISNIKDLF